jgi:hypothetical protein
MAKHVHRTRPAPAGKETIMRLLALAGAFGLALAANAQSIAPADAAPFATRQCLAAISGNGGVCFVAPYQGDFIRVHTPYGAYQIRN